MGAGVKSVITFVPDILRGLVFVLGWLRRAKSWQERNTGVLSSAFWAVEMAGGSLGWSGPRKLRQFVADIERRLGQRLTSRQLKSAEEWARKAAGDLK